MGNSESRARVEQGVARARVELERMELAAKYTCNIPIERLRQLAEKPLSAHHGLALPVLTPQQAIVHFERLAQRNDARYFEDEE
jgi:hypothetical protein